MACNKKPTKKEQRERVTLVRRLISNGFRDGEIRQVLKKSYEISTRSCNRYLARARQAMIDEIGLPKEALRADAVEFYRSVLQDKGAATRDKLRAAERIDKVLGLEAPTKIAPTNPDGTQPYAVDLKHCTDEQLDAIAALVGSGQPAGPAGPSGASGASPPEAAGG